MPATIAIDAVVLAALLPDELADVLGRIDPSGDVMHSRASAGGHDLGVLSAFNMRTHGGRRFIGANGLYLAPGLHYTSASSTPTTLGEGVELVSQACLRVQGRWFPHTIVMALAGWHVSALLEHPALVHPDLVMTASGHDRYTVLKARGVAQSPAGDPTENPISVLLPQLLEDIDPETVPS